LFNGLLAQVARVAHSTEAARVPVPRAAVGPLDAAVAMLGLHAVSS